MRTVLLLFLSISLQSFQTNSGWLVNVSVGQMRRIDEGIVPYVRDSPLAMMMQMARNGIAKNSF